MPVLSSSPEIRERVLDLTWSLWAELGISGWRHLHGDWGIDPEPLIVFTASIQDLDPRLRDESIDWCVTYGRYVSRSRLRNLLRDTDEGTISSFGIYAATVNAHSTLGWPMASSPRPYEPSGRSQLQDFTQQSLLALRLRALFGVSARAEIIRVLMGTRIPLTASALAHHVDYTKRNVAEALESLRLGGAVTVDSRGNVMQYRLTLHSLRNLVTPLPSVFPFWKAIFTVLWAVLSVDTREEARTKSARAVEARQVVQEIMPDVDAAGLAKPRTVITGEDFWDEFLRWATEVSTGLALAEPSRAFEPGQEPIW